MVEEIKVEEKKCDVDDILCQLEVLRHLKGLKEQVGKESFTTRFPELEGLDIKITNEVESHKEELKIALEKCLGEVVIEEMAEE